MPEIRLKHVVSFSTEDKVHKAENLIKPETYRKWKCASPGEKNASAVLQFEKATQIHSIDIGNESSAFVEVLVGRSSDPVGNYQVLLVASSFMSPSESRNTTNLNRVRMFGPEKLSHSLKDEKWDCVQVVCTQPFNKNISYGLSFIKFHSPPEKDSDTPNKEKQSAIKLGAFKMSQEEDDSDLSLIGSWFEKKKKKSTEASFGSPSSSGSQDSPSYAAALLASTSASPKILSQPNPAKRKHDDDDKELRSPPPKKEASITQVNRQRVGHTNVLGPTTSKQSSSQPEKTPQRSPASKPKLFNVQSPSSQQSKDKANQKEATSKRLQQTPESSRRHIQNTSDQSSNEKKKPLDQLMSRVVFVISGFVNPLRGQIRDKALEMGAKYKGDWDRSCSHLVCAFVNTPKYTQVCKAGGKIVTKDWVFDCHKKQQLLPWRNYMLGKYSRASSEDSDIDDKAAKKAEKKSPQQNGVSRSEGQWKITSRSPAASGSGGNRPTGQSGPGLPLRKREGGPGLPLRKREGGPGLPHRDSGDETEDEDAIRDYMADTDSNSNSGSGGDTEDEIRKVEEKARRKAQQHIRNPKKGVNFQDDDDEDVAECLSKPDTTNLPLPPLPNFFKKRHFFFYGELSERKHHELQRYIAAYDGILEDYMSENVKYVITESKWDKNFEEALEDNEDLIFVKPNWIYKCHETKKLVAYQPFIVIPDS